jgi:hypothetical protein
MKTLEELKKLKAEQQTTGEIALETISNIPSSGAQFVSDTITPLLSPIDTAKNLFELGKGIYNLYTPGEQPSEEVARAVGKFYYDRYGGKDFTEVKSKVLQTLKTDPVGFLSDLAIPLSVARAPLSSSSVVSKATKAIDPTNILIQTAANTPKGLSVITDATVGTMLKKQGGIGDGVLTDIFKGAQKGGDTLALMRAQMNSNKSLETALKPIYSYMEGLETVSKNRAKAYKQSKAELGLDAVKVDPAVVKRAFNKTQTRFSKITQKGKVSTPEIKAKTSQLKGLVDEWLNNPQLHTVEGLDFLKQSINDFMPDATSKTRAGAFVSDFRGNVRNAIVDEFPDYVPVMRAYEESKILEKQVKKALGSGKIEDIESIARKLQSTTRNNASTSFGIKGNLLDEISKVGEQPNLRYELAGSAVDSIAPRGLGGYSTGLIGSSGVGVGAATGNIPLAITGAAMTGASSPRLLGEVALRSGQVKGALNPALNQISNLNDILSPTYNPALQTTRILEASGIQKAAEDARRRKFLKKLKGNPENNVVPTSPGFSLDTRPDVTPQEFIRNQVPY